MRLADRMHEYGVSAVSIALVRDNRVRWTAAIGTRSATSTDSITTETLFQAASISKPVVATAVMRLVERGSMSLDDRANDLLRSWKIPDNKFTEASPVLLRHLLSHTAGATNGSVGIYQPGSPVPTLVQALDGLPPSNRPPIRIDFAPGSDYRYAGGGYSIVQQILIDRTGKSFPDLMRELLLDPLGMTHSCFCQPLPPELEARAAIGHDASGAPIAGRWWTLPEMAAGGLWTTAPDLARFVIAINKAWSSGVTGFMQRETARRMLTPIRSAWSLGFNVDTVGGIVRVSHTGSNNGYRSVFVTYPSRGDGIMILTNGDGGAALRDEILRAASVVYGWPGYEQAIRTIASTGANVAEFTGTYRYAPRFASTLEVVRDTLVARLNGGAPSTLLPENADTFFTLSGTTYRFTRDGDGGPVTGVVVTFADNSQLKGVRARP
jgi:CubicO group peptidase (beta-lactamase class C family)